MSNALTIKDRITFIWEKNRLATFNDWPISSSKACNANRLAEAGFYFVGNDDEPDTVQCFLCDKVLDGWEEDDDPWAEHLSHTSKCDFAILQQPECALSLQQLLKFKIQLNLKELEKSHREVVTKETEAFVKRLKVLQKQLRSFK